MTKFQDDEMVYVAMRGATATWLELQLNGIGYQLADRAEAPDGNRRFAATRSPDPRVGPHGVTSRDEWTAIR
jgi:hypothetical protein